MQGTDGADAGLTPGQKIGKYVIKQKLGQGAMGVVFGAEHEALGREVAIKVLRAEFAANEGVVERFQREAEAVSRIGHANIVAAYDFGRLPDGSMYYVMERINGETLSARMRRKPPLEAEETVAIFAQICRALQAAHARGVVHRDLKPDNIMLMPQEGRHPHVKVVDFGVAKFHEAKAGEQQQTTAGMVLGTPAYMAPEQIQAARTVDGRADIYALGAILYVILTDQLVFDGGMMEMLVAHISRDPLPPSQRTSRPISPALDAMVMRSLSKNPADRPADANAFLAELATAWGVSAKSSGTPATARPAALAMPPGAVASSTVIETHSSPTVASDMPIPGVSRPGQATTVGVAPVAAKPKAKGGLIGAAIGGVVVLGIGAAAIVLLRSPAVTTAAGAGSSAQKTAARSPVQIAAEQEVANALTGDALLRRAALDDMAAVGDPGAGEQIVTALGDDNPEVRRSAANAAAGVGRPGDKAMLAALVVAQGRSGGAVAVDIAAARLHLGDPAAEDELKRALEGRDPNARLRAAVALAEADKLPAGKLRPILDESQKVARRALRQVATARLVKLDAGFAAEQKKAMQEAPDPAARLDAALALARGGDATVMVPLVQLLAADPDPTDRVEAAAALTELNEVHGRAALLSSLEAAQAAVRARAATALGRLAVTGAHVPGAIEKLAPLLKDADAQVRVAAATALLAATSHAEPPQRNP